MRVLQRPTDAEMAAYLNVDRVWACYALCDLEAAQRPFARYVVVQDEHEDRQAGGAARHGWGLIYAPGGFCSVQVGGHPAAVQAVLDGLEPLPFRAVYMVPGHGDGAVRVGVEGISEGDAGPYIAALRTRYGVETLRHMWRMVLDHSAGAQQPERSLPVDAALCRLDTAHAAELAAFYDADPYRAFSPTMLSGVYYGVRRDGRLIAAAGTHAVSPHFGLAVIGNVFTREDERGQGYAQATTAAVVREVRAQFGCRQIMLNVVAGNAPALRVYERLGFRVGCAFWEGNVVRGL